VHAGSRQIPQGSGSCLSSLTFVIAGALASLERKQAEDLIKRYGGRVTQQVRSVWP
jgi:replication factor C subunit 1